MRIQVKVAGILEDYLPPNSANPIALEVAEGTTPLDVVQRLRMPANDRYLISVNGSIVPRSQQSSHTLCGDDSVSIMPPLKGG